MKRSHLPFLIGLVSLFGACNGGTGTDLSAEHRGAMRDSVLAFIEEIPELLAQDGPAAWLGFFDGTPAFFMASDGQTAFPTRDSAEILLANFSPTVANMELVWEDLRIEPLAPGVATVATPYREKIVFTDGTAVAFGGYVSGVARNNAGSWTLQHLHWSSPVAPG